MPKGWPDRDKQDSVPSGAVLLVRKRDFDVVGGFDPEIFLYCEDDDLCFRLEASYGKLMFIGNARMTHRLAGSSEAGTDTLRLNGHHLGRSIAHASLKQGKPMAFERALLRASRQAFSLRSAVSAEHRIWAFAYLQGVLGARHLNPPAGTRLRNWILRARTGKGPWNG